MKLNCWEHMGCGREPGGKNVSQEGVCRAAVDSSTDNLNDGRNDGRICWIVAGTLCEGKIQGSFARQHLSCLTCEFFMLVREEEGFALTFDKPDWI